MKIEEWLQGRVKHLKGLESRSEQQNLLLELYANENKTSQEKKDFDILVKAEKARATADDHEKAAENLIRANKDKADKARTHELIVAGAALISAGLVDSKTGKLMVSESELLGLLEAGRLLTLAGLLDKTGNTKIEKTELLGALVGLAKVPEIDQRRTEWKKAGAVILAEQK